MQPEPPPPAAPRPTAHARLRLTAVFGAISAAVLVAAYFSPWIRVDAERAQRVRDAIRSEIDRRPTAATAAKDFERLGDILARQRALTGVDIIYWSRTALNYRHQEHAAPPGGGHAPPRGGGVTFGRGIVLFGIALASAPLAALLLALYFLRHRFRRAHSPALILSLLTGVLAVALAGIYEFLLEPMSPDVRPALGLSMLLGSGAGFVMLAIFGVTTRNWWRVYGGALVTAAGLGVVAYTYLHWGLSP